MSESRVTVMMVDAQGGGGIGHYTFNLCSAIRKVETGIKLTLVSKPMTELSNLPKQFKVVGALGRVRHYPFWIWRLIALLAAGKPHIVHIQAHTWPIMDAFLIILLRLLRMTVVFTAHDVLPHRVGLFDRRAFEWIYRVSNKIIVHADRNRDVLLSQFGIDRRKVEVIPHGNYSFFPPYGGSREAALTELGCPDNADVLLFFGFITDYKGLDYIITALPEIIRLNPSVRLVVAGKPDKEGFGRYDTLIDSLGLRPYVKTRLEYVPFEEVTKYFAACRLVVLPYVDTYQSGVVQIAFACGRPVVASAVGGLIEVVRPGLTGSIVPAKDSTALAQSIVELLSDKEQLGLMGQAAAKAASEVYGWEGIAISTIKVYKSLIDEKDGRYPGEGTN